MAQRYSHIIWDWNGTLFDDAAWCVEVNNRMLAARGLRPIAGIEEYRNVFAFPVINYYRQIGLDFKKEPFEALAHEYNAAYYAGVAGGLHAGAEAVLEAVYNEGVAQVILSASEKNNLISQVSQFGIAKYFDKILGVSDIYGKSKVELALDYIAANHVDRALLVGDTDHDYETALAIGADCVLIPNGHQSRARLLACGAPVLEDIRGVLNCIRTAMSNQTVRTDLPKREGGEQ